MLRRLACAGAVTGIKPMSARAAILENDLGIISVLPRISVIRSRPIRFAPALSTGCGEPEGVRGVSALGGSANFAARLIPRRPPCQIPMTPSPRRLLNIVAGSKLLTQGSGPL